jgi:large subunit ribosomal protein L17
MKKQKKGRVFSREKSQRKALLLSLGRALVMHEKITTTEAKAKEVAPFVEKLITKAKKGDLAARRQLALYCTRDLVKKLIEDIAPRFESRAGGYTRIHKLGQRSADSARMAIVELVS